MHASSARSLERERESGLALCIMLRINIPGVVGSWGPWAAAPPTPLPLALWSRRVRGGTLGRTNLFEGKVNYSATKANTSLCVNEVAVFGLYIATFEAVADNLFHPVNKSTVVQWLVAGKPVSGFEPKTSIRGRPPKMCLTEKDAQERSRQERRRLDGAELDWFTLLAKTFLKVEKYALLTGLVIPATILDNEHVKSFQEYAAANSVAAPRKWAEMRRKEILNANNAMFGRKLDA